MNKLLLSLSALILSFPSISQVQVTQNTDENVKMFIAQSDNELMIEVKAHSFDMIGYEFSPTNLNEKIEYNRALTILQNPNTFMAVNEEANCRLTKKNVQHKLNDQSQFTARYSYQCTYPKQIKDIKSHWFKSFPSTDKISISAQMEDGSKNGEVTAKSRRFYF